MTDGVLMQLMQSSLQSAVSLIGNPQHRCNLQRNNDEDDADDDREAEGPVFLTSIVFTCILPLKTGALKTGRRDAAVEGADVFLPDDVGSQKAPEDERQQREKGTKKIERKQVIVSDRDW